jgi:hypothetical protein
VLKSDGHGDMVYVPFGPTSRDFCCYIGSSEEKYVPCLGSFEKLIMLDESIAPEVKTKLSIVN